MARSKLTCYECGEAFKRGEPKMTVKLFDNPYEKNPKIIYLHADNDDTYGSCFEKAFDTSYGDFRLFDCEACGRTINMQCLSNGWHSYVRGDDDGNNICLQCFENHQFEHGCSRETYEKGQITGTFTGEASFEDHGFEKVESYNYFFINGDATAKSYCKKALELIDQGFLVMNEYERMGIGGLEGYVTMWHKRGTKVGGVTCQKEISASGP
jgi:hypothetical protein